MKKMNNPQKSTNDWLFSHDDKFFLHTLLAKQEWVEKGIGKSSAKNETAQITPDTIYNPEKIQKSWSLSSHITLYDWQKKCIDAWFSNNGHGTVKVVTGAGKTILALAIIERLKNESEPDLRVAIVVPKIVLMDQWLTEFKENTNIPLDQIGRVSGDYDDNLVNKRILICVINSAEKKLQEIVESTKCGEKLLLIVDECHRAGSDKMCNIFNTLFRYSLGLSATPERESDNEETGDDNETQVMPFRSVASYNEQIVGKKLGPIIFELTLNDANNEGIIPTFEIRHYGLMLTSVEKNQYDNLTKVINDIRDQLREDKRSQKYHSEREFNRWLYNRKSKNDGALSEGKNKFLVKVADRKQLLYQAKSRKEAVLYLLKMDLKENPQSKIIIFHENIEESMNIWKMLIEADIRAAPENSALSPPLRIESIDLFRQGIVNVLVSVRSLVEGFNVPSTDTGIIVASSSSIRQRIQTYGRLLRRNESHNGKEKHAVIHILYIANSVDDSIYRKVDWATITGAHRNSYYIWDILNHTPPVIQAGPPRSPSITDREIDDSKLFPGSTYPGAYEGVEFSADSQGNVYLEGDRTKLIQNPQDVPALLKKSRNTFGRFMVTPNKHFVLSLKHLEDEWIPIFITKLKEPFRYVTTSNSQASLIVDNLSIGQESDKIFSKNSMELFHKQKGNETVIVKKIKKDEIYARSSGKAHDPAAGNQADSLKNAIQECEHVLNQKISKFFISPEKIAYVLFGGKAYFIAKIDNELEFPLK
jgi:superfamily II DNA or RNA helicase